MESRSFHGTLAPPWKVVAASIQGPGHKRQGVPRQDAFAYHIDGERLVAVVSDGAGSAAAAEIGALATVSRMTEALSGIALDPVRDGPERWRPAIETAIWDLRDHLGELARARGDGDDLSAFHATLVATVATPVGGLFLHIGDGTAQAGGGPGGALAPLASSLPANGEEANTTYFVTLDDWRESLRLTVFRRAQRLVLMTDGAMPFAAGPRAGWLEPAFMGPVDAYLSGASVKAGAEALADTLDDPEAARISGDDKTLIWASVL